MLRAVIKDTIQNFLKRRGLKISHNRDDHFPPEINLLDILCRERFRSTAPGIAIQVGANDGQGADPFSAVLESFPSMRAILIEPLEPAVSALRRRYQDDSRAVVMQVALDQNTGTRDIFRVSCEGPDNQRFSELASFDRATIEKHYSRIRSSGGKIIQESIRTLSVEDLLKEIGIAEVDILQVDVEGHDAEIVKGFLQQAVFPKVINFEHIHLCENSDAELLKQLRQKEYKIVRAGRDTTAIRF